MRVAFLAEAVSGVQIVTAAYAEVSRQVLGARHVCLLVPMLL